MDTPHENEEGDLYNPPRIPPPPPLKAGLVTRPPLLTPQPTERRDDINQSLLVAPSDPLLPTTTPSSPAKAQNIGCLEFIGSTC